MNNYRKEVEEIFGFSLDLELPLLMEFLIEHCNNYHIHPTEITKIIVHINLKEVLLFSLCINKVVVCYCDYTDACLYSKYTLVLN